MDSRGRANVTLTYLGERKADLAGTTSMPAFTTLDLGMSLARGSWTLAAQLANVGNERGIMSITNPSPTSGQYYLQRPRTLNVTLRYDY